MGLFNKFKSLFCKTTGKEVNDHKKNEYVIDTDKIAAHEAAHGVVWYLFKDYWTVNKLTIESEGLPHDDMNGALHISPNFKPVDNTINRANELFAIALAGMIGQNLKLIADRPHLIIEITNAGGYHNILDTRGCGGDFDICREYLKPLTEAYKINETNYTNYKIFDLIYLFQEHEKVRQIHASLFLLLRKNKTLTREELLEFFEKEKFQEYIDDEDLTYSFFNN